MKINLIKIEQKEDYLIFERLKRSELLIVENEDTFEVYVNIESDEQSEEERAEIQNRYNVKLNEFILYALPRLQFMALTSSRLDRLFREKIYIKKGWEDQFKMSGIYVGWGVETYENAIELIRCENKTELKWTCILYDMDRYDERSRPFKAEINAELEVIQFRSKQEYWDYEKEKLEGKK